MSRQETLPDDLDRPDLDATQPDRLLQQDELYRALELAVQQLSPQRQRVFLFSRFEGKSYKEIALEMNSPLKQWKIICYGQLPRFGNSSGNKNELAGACCWSWLYSKLNDKSPISWNHLKNWYLPTLLGRRRPFSRT